MNVRIQNVRWGSFIENVNNTFVGNQAVGGGTVFTVIWGAAGQATLLAPPANFLTVNNVTNLAVPGAAGQAFQMGVRADGTWTRVWSSVPLSGIENSLVPFMRRIQLVGEDNNLQLGGANVQINSAAPLGPGLPNTANQFWRFVL